MMKNIIISKIKHRIIVGLWFLLALGSTLFLLESQHSGQILETDIMALFPSFEKDSELEIALNQAREKADSKVIFLIGHKDIRTAINGAEKFSSILNRDPSIKQVQSRITEEFENEWWRFYSQYSQNLLTPQLRTLLLEGKGKVWQQNVLSNVYSPFAAVSANELRADPLLLTRNFLENLSQPNNSLSTENGWLVASDENDKKFVLISATIAIKPYSLVDAEALVNRIEEIIVDLAGSEPGLECLRQGTLFYAAHGINQAKDEISTIGVGSILGVLLLLFFVFRSIQPFCLGGLSVFLGLLFAAAATVAIFGEIHLFTLAIGASLIGVSIDYSFHYLCEWLSEGEGWEPFKALRVIMPAITLGFLTSVLAYLVLLVTPFPGLRQLAVFSSTGLLAAFSTVVFLYPISLKTHSTKGPHIDKLQWARSIFFQQPKARWAICIVLIGMFLIVIPGLTVNDDIRQLQAAPKELRQEGQKIAALIGQNDFQHLLLIRDVDENMVLNLLAKVSTRLDESIQRHSIQGYRSLSSILPSVEQQKDDYNLIQQTLFEPLLEGLVEQVGLPPETTQEVMDAPFQPITIDQWLNSSVSDDWQMLWLGHLQKHYGSIISLNGVRNSQDAKALAAEFDGVDYISRVDELSEIFKSFRVKVSMLLILSYLGIFLFLCLRYGIVKSGLILLAPFLAGMSSLAALSIAGLPLNLFGVLGLVLVLGIGVDYTLFFAECRKEPMATLLAVTLSACTTLLSFGLLFLSETTAIKTFGLVVLVGIFVAFVLSPIAYNGQIQRNLE